ncbi:polysaccharide deacetylase family protein [Solirubrobacter soli]|uniref:polysaccharide deacetylase family protein n=1 Tax=Solirubrobacter soli TaxID=363832 RepID=UPI0004209B6F|nr:polysaccharide deacetylase family protein [Solirubrobacter soli]
MRARWICAAVAVALAGCGGSSKHQEKPPPKRTPTATPKPKTTAAAVAARSHVPVLCYHQIRPRTGADSATDRQYIVSPSVLDKQFQALADAGYTPISGEDYVAHMARGAKLPRKPILLTFDDASAGQYTQALPILRKHHFRATFFVMTVVLGKPGWLTKGQVRALDRAGMTIGAHTYDHKAVPEYTTADYKTQFTDPGRELRRIVGHKVELFAYPFGSYSSDAIQPMFSAGYRAAFQLSDKLDKQHPLWSIRRIIVPELTGKQLLREIRRDF